MIKVIFFDLDGTLADTAPDLGGALNRLRAADGLPAIPIEHLRPHVSGGGRALLRQGYGLRPEDANYPDYLQRFLDLYQQHVCAETCLFPDMAEVLDQLDRQNIKWGIVTNKAQRFTREVVRQLGLDRRAASVISGDSTPNPKPAPDPLLLACREAGVAPEACLYLGDDRRDIAAGQAAGMHTAIAAWGYLGLEPELASWGADLILAQPRDILHLFA